MTAITPRHAPGTRSEAQLLRFALRADATLCAGLGLFAAAVTVVLVAGRLPLTGFAFRQYLGVRRLA